MEQKIISVLKRARRAPMSLGEIIRKSGVSKKDTEKFKSTFYNMVQEGKIFPRQSKYILTENLGLKVGTVVQINQKFGFAKPTSEQSDKDWFIPGRALKGAMPGDIVIMKSIKSRGESPEGEIVHIAKYGKGTFTGVVQMSSRGAAINPDGINIPFGVSKNDLNGAHEGDKVLARIVKRGERHFGHRAAVIKQYGNSQSAQVCALSVLDLNGVTAEFTDEQNQYADMVAEKGITEKDLQYRMDFRNDVIFTIDSADSKDLDDAVSIRRDLDGYVLGVHIADVSHYIREKSLLDIEALERGTSIYYADRVIPMLPKQISNGICSLNPNEERLAFSAIIDLDKKGNITAFKFVKSVIKSRVKGVYSEINTILDKTAAADVMKKYDGLFDAIALMDELADILMARRYGRGALNLETSESKIITDENGDVANIVPRTRGKSEKIIEEFMLTANEAAAKLAEQNEIPFVYRIHENPSEDKLSALADLLSKLGINAKNVRRGVKPGSLSEILNSVKGTNLEQIVNNQMLRSMAKAKYSDECKGHFGLMLDDYCHFTSPIRRYPDLAIHRILTSLVTDMPVPKLVKKYSEFSKIAASKSTECELRAMRIERDCEDIYKAEYISKFIGEEFDGTISSAAPQGIYVELENTVEGLVRTAELKGGQYELEDGVRYKNLNTGATYSVGDKIRIVVAGADIPSGKIDFALPDLI